MSLNNSHILNFKFPAEEGTCRFLITKERSTEIKLSGTSVLCV